MSLDVENSQPPKKKRKHSKAKNNPEMVDLNSESKDKSVINNQSAESDVRIRLGEDIDTKSSEAFIAMFENGSLRHDCGDNLTFKLMKPSSGRADWRVVTAESNRMQYTGKNYENPDSKFQKLYQHFVGVHDKKTGEMALHPVHTFTMNTVQNEAAGATTETTNSKDFRTQRKELIEAFGNSRMKRLATSRERNRLDQSTIESSVSHALSFSKPADTDQAADDAVEDCLKGFIPPYDKGADCAELIYNVHDIISVASLELIAQTETAQSFMKCSQADVKQWAGTKDTPPIYPQLILKGLKFKPSAVDALERKCALFVLYYYLTDLQKMQWSTLQRKNAFYDWDIPKSVLQEMLQSYARLDNEKWTLTTRDREKLTTYIIVLALMLSGFSVDLGLLLADLKIKSARLEVLCKAVGCEIANKTTGEKTADLSAPLTFYIKARHINRMKKK